MKDSVFGAGGMKHYGRALAQRLGGLKFNPQTHKKPK